MRIAGRLALQSTPPLSELALPVTGYHGCDVVVRQISVDGFEADLVGSFPQGSLVRLRLPGAGMMLARVAESRSGSVSAAFVNPVHPMRLGKTLGLAVAA
jgi:hypothetical protein